MCVYIYIYIYIYIYNCMAAVRVAAFRASLSTPTPIAEERSEDDHRTFYGFDYLLL